MTTIAPGKFVVLDYTLKDEDGDEIQRSADEEVGPLTYVHGYSPILPGLHKGLEGLHQGDTKEVKVPPEEGYGPADEDAIFEVDRAELPNPEGVKFGDEIVAEDDDGNEFAMHVVEVHDDVWDVTVREVRDATQAEIDRARADAAELEVSADGTD